MIEQDRSSQGGNPLKWILAAAGGIGFVAWMANLDSKSATVATTPSAQSSETNSTLESSEAALSPPPPLPLDQSAARRGYAQFRMIAAAQVPGGSEIFSQNCYDALSKPFDWHQLDRCGAYDALAVRWTEDNDGAAGNDDLTYFQSETTATRYLNAATSGGLPADQADVRWAALQTMADKARLATKAAEPQAAPMDTDKDGDDVARAGDGSSDAGNGVAPDPAKQEP